MKGQGGVLPTTGVLMITYKACGIEKALSNLCPNAFVLLEKKFASMEGFLQSLKTNDPTVAKRLAGLHGVEAWREGQKWNIWKETQTLYFCGKPYQRQSGEYQALLCSAYDALISQSDAFRRAIYASIGYTLDHKGKTDTRDSVLTKHEYLFQLYRLQARLP